MKPGHDRRAKGRAAETHAAAYLVRQGFEILARNFSNREGELDLVVSRGSLLVFVEVKARWSREEGDPLEAVTEHKKRQVIKTARAFLAEHGKTWEEIRFDCLGMTWDETTRDFAIEWVEDAFRADR
mgnify:CR=1 FL=1